MSFLAYRFSTILVLRVRYSQHTNGRQGGGKLTSCDVIGSRNLHHLGEISLRRHLASLANWIFSLVLLCYRFDYM